MITDFILIYKISNQILNKTTKNSVVKRTFYISVATPLPTLQKKLLAQFLEKTRTLRNLRQ